MLAGWLEWFRLEVAAGIAGRQTLLVSTYMICEMSGMWICLCLSVFVDVFLVVVVFGHVVPCHVVWSVSCDVTVWLAALSCERVSCDVTVWHAVLWCAMLWCARLLWLVQNIWCLAHIVRLHNVFVCLFSYCVRCVSHVFQNVMCVKCDTSVVMDFRKFRTASFFGHENFKATKVAASTESWYQYEKTKGLKIKRADCHVKLTCFNHQHFDSCKRSTPPLQCSSASICEMVTSDKNLKVSSTMLRSSSWRAQVHGDNWQRSLILSERYVDPSSCCTRSPLALAHFRLHGMFFGWEEPNGTSFGLKTFHCMAVGIQYLYAERVRCLPKSWSAVEYYCRHRDSIICFPGRMYGVFGEKL